MSDTDTSYCPTCQSSTGFTDCPQCGDGREKEAASTSPPLKILIACEYSGVVRDAFIAYGHDAWSCDLLPSEKEGPHFQCDVRDVLDNGWDAMIGHPVCKRLANSGRRWLHNPPNGKTMVQMWGDFFAGVEFYKALRDAPIPFKAIENPVMHDHARECLSMGRRQIVQPWWFGDKAFKATGWELIGFPELIPTDKLTPPEKDTEEHRAWSWVHRMPPGPNREKERSRFHLGMASAMAQQWGGFLSSGAEPLPAPLSTPTTYTPESNRWV